MLLNSRRSLYLLVGLSVAAVVWGLTDVRRRGRPHPGRPLSHRTDLTVFTEAGAAFFDGRSPYEVSNPRGWQYLYPPPFAMLLAPLHAMATEDQVVVWFFVGVLACWGCYREGRLILRGLCPQDGDLAARFRRWLPWLGVAALGAGLLPTLNCLQRGQVGVVMLYLLLLGLRLVFRGRSYRAWVGGGIVLAVPIAIKVIPILPVALFLFVQWVAALGERRVGSRRSSTSGRQLVGSTAGVVVGLVLWMVVVPGSLVGFRTNVHHLGTWYRLVVLRSDDTGDDPLAGLDEHTGRNQSLGNAAYRLGNFLGYVFGGPDDRLIAEPDPPALAMDSPRAKRAVLALRLAVLVGLLAVGVRLGRQRDRLSQALGFALACVAMLVVSPISRGHYFMFLVPATVLLPLWLDRRGMPRAAAAMAVPPGVLSLSHYGLLPYAGRIGLLGLGTTCWLVAAMVFVETAARRAARRTGRRAARRAARRSGHEEVSDKATSEEDGATAEREGPNCPEHRPQSTQRSTEVQ